MHASCLHSPAGNRLLLGAAGAYLLGTITLLVVKADERTGRYRDRSANLRQFSEMTSIPHVSPPPPPPPHPAAHKEHRDLLATLPSPPVDRIALRSGHRNERGSM